MAESGDGETGVRTFLIADVRGYTSYTLEHGDEAAARLAERFAQVAEEIVSGYGGEVAELRGDEALGVFRSPRAALRAAVDLQVRLDREREVSALPLHVGIGIDAGEAVPVRGGYRGSALNLAARLCSIAGPGEVFASEGVIHLARRVDGLAFVDRGEVRLKGLGAPIRVMQIAAEGALPGEITPLQPILVTQPTNLPDEPTPFIGREDEIRDIVDLLHRPGVRLLTLTGTGGTGKTRLALQVGSRLLFEFDDGVFFVSLASLADPSLVTATIVDTLGIREEGGRLLFDTLIDHLRHRNLLLVLDNFEHLLDAAPVVSDLLNACRSVRILVTSRSPLHIAWEREYAVPPLAVPDPQRLPEPNTLAGYESVAMFLDRAQAVRPDFELTGSNAHAVAEICNRLDGLPLALELAAARVKLFPPQALAQRLSHRLPLLIGGSRDRLARHRTLRATIEWSYSLLDSAEQTLFARLAVFAGGCTLEATEEVCDPTAELDTLDLLGSLIDKSLLRQEGEEEARVRMLETIREFAQERLVARGDEADVRERHAVHFERLAEEGEIGIRGPQQKEWLRRLETEHDNLRAALAWTLERGEDERARRLGAALWRFWWMQGYWTEGRRWLESILAPESPASVSRGGAVSGLANIVWAQGDLDLAEELHREALALREALGDHPGVATSLNNLGVVTEQRGAFEEAVGWYERGLAAAREVGNDWTTALLLGNLGGVVGNLEQYERALELGEESLQIWRRLGDRASEGRVLNNLASIALETGRIERAVDLQRESLALYLDLGAQENIAVCLEGVAKIAARTGKAEGAARALGAAEGLREALGQPPPPAEIGPLERLRDALRADLGEAHLAAMLNEGASWSLEAAGAYALDLLEG